MALRTSLLWLLPHKWVNLSEIKRWMAARDSADGRFGLLLALCFGFLQSYRWANKVDDLVMRAIASVIIGLVAGLAVYLAGGGLLNWSLRALGGSGDVEATRSGLFLASIPLLWAMVLAAGYGLLDRTIELSTDASGILLYALVAFYVAAVVWSLVLAIVALRQAHAITGVRVFAAILMAAAIGYLPWVTCATLMDSLL